MTIRTSIPSNQRRPGTSAEFDVTSAARGLTPLTQRLALIGAKTTAGTQAVATPVQVFTELDAETYFGKGSELALMVRSAIKAAALYGSGPQLWCVAVADPGGGVKAQRTFTVTGPATAAGDLVIKLAGRTVRVPVANGDSANTIAASIKSAIDSLVYDLPVTATVATNVATTTANNAGVNGNDIAASVVSAPSGVSVAIAASVAGSGAYDITASLDVLTDKRYDAIAIANHTSTDIDDLQVYVDARNAPGVKAWSMAYVAETGTLSAATTLAGGANQKEIVLVSAEAFPNMTGEIAAAVAATVEGEDDPAHNFDGQELDLYVPVAASVPTNSEIETALAAGVTPLSINDTLDRAKIVRLVTTKTTEAGAPFENLLDASNVRSLFYVATQVDAKLKLVLQGAKKNDRTKKRVKSVVLDVLRKCEELEILQNVEDHLGEIQVEDDSIVSTRLNVAVPNSVVPNLHQLAVVHTLFIEG